MFKKRLIAAANHAPDYPGIANGGRTDSPYFDALTGRRDDSQRPVRPVPLFESLGSSHRANGPGIVCRDSRYGTKFLNRTRVNRYLCPRNPIPVFNQRMAWAVILRPTHCPQVMRARRCKTGQFVPLGPRTGRIHDAPGLAVPMFGQDLAGAESAME